MSWRLANSTMRSKNSSSTHMVVGLWGKDRMSIRGRGRISSVMLHQVLEEIPVVGERYAHQLPPGNDHAGRVDGVSGVGHQHHVPGHDRGQHQVGQALLGPDGGDGLGLGVDIHVEAALVPVRDGHPELGDALGRGIAVVGPLAGRLDEFCHDVGRGSQVGVPHPQINDILAPATGFHLQGVYRGKNIRRQPLHAREFFHRHRLLLQAKIA